LIRRPVKNRLGQKRSKSIRAYNKKRGREPQKVHDQTSKQKSKLNYLTVKSSGREWNVTEFPRSGSALAVSVRRSASWLSNMKFPTTSCELPFIDNVGKFTGYGVYRVNWSPASYIGTVCATIWRRLKFFILRKTSIGEFNKRQNLYMRCCAYYALSKNEYFWNRLLALTRQRSGWRTISRLLHRFSSKLDDHKWFVYGQVCLQTYWLTFRAVRPRDKSANYDVSFTTRERKFSSREEINDFVYNSVWHTFCEMCQYGL